MEMTPDPRVQGLDTMPPEPGELFPDHVMRSSLPETVPHHLSLWCKVNYVHDPEHHVCAAVTCDSGHGTDVWCGQPCECYCHG
jgi:hypothetical protein